MINIKIESEFLTYEDAMFAMLHIGKLIELGYKRGYYPFWNIEGREGREIELKLPEVVQNWYNADIVANW